MKMVQSVLLLFKNIHPKCIWLSSIVHFQMAYLCVDSTAEWADLLEDQIHKTSYS